MAEAWTHDHNPSMTTSDHHEMGVALIAAGGSQLVEAASLLTLSLFADLDEVKPSEVREMAVSGEDENQLLEAWLRRLMDVCQNEDFLISRVRVGNRGPHSIAGEAWGEKIDPSRHRLHRSPGTVVLQEARVVQHKDAFRARLAFDMPRETP